MQRQTSSIESYMDGLLDPQSVLYILAFLLVAACAGGIIGLLTRSMVFLIGIVAMTVAFLEFHHYLPLPELVHVEINAFKSRLGL